LARISLKAAANDNDDHGNYRQLTMKRWNV